MNLSDVEKGYIAGVVDGEGCFQIEKFPNYATISLMVYNTKETLIKWFLVRIGGYAHRTPRTGKKSIYMWRLRNKQAINLIKEIYPFLVVKKSQAEIALAAYETIRRQQDGMADSKGLPEGHKQQRIKYHLLMRQANA